MNRTTPIALAILFVVIGGVWWWYAAHRSGLPSTAQLPNVYQSDTYQFTINYPDGWSADAAYAYQAFGPGKDIKGVKFTVPEAMAAGTNLSSDSYLSVEAIPNQPQCTADKFFDGKVDVSRFEDSDAPADTNYSFASSSGAGAGNRYEERVYALPGAIPCIAVRYFIHYAAFENFPEGTVTKFNEKALTDAFDAIRRTLVIAH